ncbi:similar to Saccharomyces cerevisiae YGL232W TAN1 Putative tRNA acetyltransferase [Geotrichum candidum]|uniref:Similar to Saccharomyces cerevisiae YGL232W TAN1 Putative tRNA acetyltransferase n=1 Tax=Geotrichum candidum TaxID=1173061 RepID=A0A0J9X2R3_GEOCN|nr:similar to Saccharomyces cerevisiae YGL232W TAN1 Putative tRNA acetyltransferase [Geotrichum candidum]
MAKRKGDNNNMGSNKKSKKLSGANVEPGWSGIYVTCVRGKEAACKNEIVRIFDDYAHEFYGPELQRYLEDLKAEEENAPAAEEKQVFIEDLVAQEIAELKDANQAYKTREEKKKEFFSGYEIGCECVIFIRTRKPIDPVDLVLRICRDTQKTGTKRSRYAQRLTPVSLTGVATAEGFRKLAETVLNPIFHSGSPDQPAYKFAIRPTLRNHSILGRDEIIKTLAEIVCRSDGHSVDLKQYDKMIIVECYKSSIGMSVVDEFDSLERLNIQQIFEKAQNYGDDK